MTETQPPLSGRTILVTRSREQASDLTRQLQALGASVIEIPTIAILLPHSYQPLDAALASLHQYDWLIVTSANTARVLRHRLDALRLPLNQQPRTVAIGPATAAALHAAGFRVDLTPTPAVAESVVAALEHQVAGQCILLARAQAARDLLPHALSQAGATVTIVDAYRTVLAEDSAAQLATLFSDRAHLPAALPGSTSAGPPTIDALTFTSSSTATNFHALLQMADLPWPPAPRVFSIGPITTQTLRQLGIEPHLEATHHTIPGLVQSLLQGLSHP